MPTCWDGDLNSYSHQAFNGPYRVALAHAGEVDAGKPLTVASYEDYQKVASQVPVVRYMANVMLENVQATLDAEVGREQEKPSTGTMAEAEGDDSGSDRGGRARVLG